MKKYIALIFCIITLAFIDYSGTYMIRYLNQRVIPESVSAKRSVVYVSYVSSLLATTFLILIILIISFFLRKTIHYRSVAKAGIITGLTGSIIAFLFLYSFSISWGYKPNIGVILFCIKAFTIGFLFPVLYRWLNKKPLFNEHFY